MINEASLEAQSIFLYKTHHDSVAIIYVFTLIFYKYSAIFIIQR